MNNLRLFISIIIILLAVFGVYLLVDYLLDDAIEKRLEAKICRLERLSRPLNIRWNRESRYYTGEQSDLPEITAGRGARIIRRMMSGRDDRKRLWGALLAVENGMKPEGLKTLVDLMMHADRDYMGGLTFAEKAWQLLLDNIGEKDRPPIFTKQERERVRGIVTGNAAPGSYEKGGGPVYR